MYNKLIFLSDPTEIFLLVFFLADFVIIMRGYTVSCSAPEVMFVIALAMFIMPELTFDNIGELNS